MIVVIKKSNLPCKLCFKLYVFNIRNFFNRVGMFYIIYTCSIRSTCTKLDDNMRISQTKHIGFFITSQKKKHFLLICF